jgi:predicted phosphodiesterase
MRARAHPSKTPAFPATRWFLDASEASGLLLRTRNHPEKVEKKMASRTIVVGDIHGCYDELEDLLKAVSFGEDDRLISVGDLITKGPKSRQVLDRFMSDAQFSAVIGNHDLALRRRWNGEKFKLKESQKPTHKELKKDKDHYLPFLNALPFMIDLETHLVVHAGIRPGVALHSQTTDDLTELRSLGKDRAARDGMPWYQEYDGEKVVLFGHWPAPEPRLARKAIGLDTGCVYGNKLTAYIIETGEFKTVPARRAYDPS